MVWRGEDGLRQSPVAQPFFGADVKRFHALSAIPCDAVCLCGPLCCLLANIEIDQCDDA